LCDIVPIELAGLFTTFPDDDNAMEFSLAFSGSRAAKDDLGLCGSPPVLLKLPAGAEVADKVLLGCC